MKYSLLLGVTILSVAAISPVTANAHDGHVHSVQESTDVSQAEEVSKTTDELKSTDQRSTTQQAGTDRKETTLTRLAGSKLKTCHNHQKAITNIATRIADRGQKQVELFSTIADRTESFYTSKGKTLANYNALVADVVAKKAAAQSVVDAVTSGSVTFDCSSDNPKGAVSSFKNGLKAEIDALKAYKTSVKNLIVGVKSVQGTTSSEKKAQQ